MRKTVRIIGPLLIIALIFSTWSVTFASSDSLGENLYESHMDIGERMSLAKGVFWNTAYNEKITENYIEYMPGKSIKPIIAHGNDIYGAASFKSVVSMAAANDQYVVAGLNGDFFDMSNGVPMGITIKNGILLSSESAQRPSLGFFEDGSLIIGRPEVKISASGENIGKGFSFLHLNKTLTPGSGVVLYTRVYGDDFSNKAKIASYNVLLSVENDEFRINDAFEGIVVETTESDLPTIIPPGHVLLSISLNTVYPDSLTRLMGAQPGDIISFTVNGDSTWDEVEYAIGTGDKLVSGGQMLPPADKEMHPRTAVGIRADGSAVFYTADGRQADHSKGLTLQQLSERMLELGCVEAVNMDGGGSTALHGIFPGEESMSVINQPSQATLRNCANYILLINTSQPVGNPAHLHIYPYEARILAGSEISFRVKASDANYYPVMPPTNISFSYTGNVGDMAKTDQDYIFSASKNKAKGSITASSGNKLKGSTGIEIVDKPEKLEIIDEATGKTVNAINIVAGEEVNLKGSSTYKRMPLLSSDKAYTWTVTGNIGTVNEEGVFKAADINKGSGQIQASVNGVTATVNVSIQSEGWLVESFEGTKNFFRDSAWPGAELSLNADLTKVKYGYKSALIKYDFDEAESDTIIMPVKANFSKPPRMLGFYLYGDGSGNDIELTVNTGEGRNTLKAATLDFKGWKLVTVSLPAGTNRLEAINISVAGKSSGSFYLDQFVAGIGYYVDTESPTIDMSFVDGLLTAVIKDETDKSVTPSNVRLTMDGEVLDFQMDESTGVLQKWLDIEDSRMHRLAIVASDETGNLARKGISIKIEGSEEDSAEEDIFIDTRGHWGRANIDYLYGLGVINGVKTDQGLKYNPDKSITRAEFAVLMSNWLAGDATEYADTELPFLDKGAIPAWAVDSVKAVYGMGIVAGTGTDKGVVFNPSGSISRQEVMTIIGRTQAKGYGEVTLTDFADHKDVADWAYSYVSSLVKQGVISGSGGKLNPGKSVTRAEVATIITGLN